MEKPCDESWASAVCIVHDSSPGRRTAQCSWQLSMVYSAGQCAHYRVDSRCDLLGRGVLEAGKE